MFYDPFNIFKANIHYQISRSDLLFRQICRICYQINLKSFLLTLTEIFYIKLNKYTYFFFHLIITIDLERAAMAAIVNVTFEKEKESKKMICNII